MKYPEEDVVYQFVRFRDINYDTWARDYPTTSDAIAFITYFITVYIVSLIQISFIAVEIIVVAFLLPSFGIGDKYFYPSMVLDPVIPQGLAKYALLAGIFLLLVGKLYNFIFLGIFTLRDSSLTLGTVVTNRYVRRLVTQSSLTKWRYIRHLNTQLQHSAQLMGWILYAKDEWKRFVTVKLLIVILACIQIQAVMTKRSVYGAGGGVNKSIQTAFVVYFGSRITLFVFELLNKLAACFAYFINFFKGSDIPTGLSLEDAYQMKCGSLAVSMAGYEGNLRTAVSRAFPDPIYSYKHASYETRGVHEGDALKIQIPEIASAFPDNTTPMRKESLFNHDDDNDSLDYNAIQREIQGTLSAKKSAAEPSPLPYRNDVNHSPLIDHSFLDDDEEEEVPPWMRYTLMTDLTRQSNPHGL
jgi:hypothetical protein